MKNQALFSSKNKTKKLKCCLLQFLFGTLRVKTANLNRPHLKEPPPPEKGTESREVKYCFQKRGRGHLLPQGHLLEG